MDICSERYIPFFIRNIFDRFETGLMGCVVDQDVDASKFFYLLCDD